MKSLDNTPDNRFRTAPLPAGTRVTDNQEALPRISIEQLHKQITHLRNSPISLQQRSLQLDILYKETEQLLQAERPLLLTTTLPITRQQRQRIRLLRNILENLSQDYLNTLAVLFDPQHTAYSPISPAQSLRKALQSTVWNIQINHLIASPQPSGIWHDLHNIFRTAMRLELIGQLDASEIQKIEPLYMSALLVAIVQPSSFNPYELELLEQYLQTPQPVSISQQPPGDTTGVFWIDPDTDHPPCAIVRRPPPPDISAWFFSCKKLAQSLQDKISALNKGMAPGTLGLPSQSASSTGRRLLDCLAQRWGNPGKRRFPRRRQNTRARLCIGLDSLWQLLHATPSSPIETSEWMVINESPEGYALMHMSGALGALKVGDIVAIQTGDHSSNPTTQWLYCLIRWATSENPENIELGLQLIASKAMAADVIWLDQGLAIKHLGLMIPESPPVRHSPSLILSAGKITAGQGKLVVMTEQENLQIRELHPTRLEVQTASIDIFSIEPDETSSLQSIPQKAPATS